MASRSRRSLRFATIAVMGNPRDARTLETLRALTGHLISLGRRVRVSRSINGRAMPKGAERVPNESVADGVSLAISVGGDGSMLYAARHIAGRGVPLLGVNRGRLGFLADLSPEQMLLRIEEVLEGRYVSENRMLLNATLMNGKRKTKSGFALNDVVVKRHSTGRMVEYQTFVDGTYVNTHLGDGFIVATPTGSTAYALSCGGPIVQPGLDALVLTPICPHTLSDRPIVIPGTRVVDVCLRAGKDDVAEVNCDGEPLGSLGAGWTVRVSSAKERIELIHPVGYDYFEILRSKLLWGRDTRERGAQNV